MSRWLALFDFDETLIRENSLGELFSATGRCGPLWWESLAVIGSGRLYRNGLRAAIKHRLYRRCLAGCNEPEIRAIGGRIAPRVTPNQAVVRALEEIATRGGSPWVVTATPRAFVQGIIAALGWPVERVIGTELPTTADRYTGELRDECVREAKIHRIRAAIGQPGEQGTPRIRVAYGNAPADLPMLALAERGYVVRRGHIEIHH